MPKFRKLFLILIFGVSTTCIAVIVCAGVSPKILRHLTDPSARLIYGYHPEVAEFGGVTVNEEARVLVYGDVSEPAQLCGAESMFYCVNARDFHFAVPRMLEDSVPAWTVGGYTYSVHPENPIQEFAGHKLVVDVIVSNENNFLSWTYYYSPKWGLLGFEQKKGNEVIKRTAVSCFGFGGTESGSLVHYLFDKCWSN